MSVSRVIARNFRRFYMFDSGELTPLTIVCGPNSSGKSSFLASLLAFAQTRFHEETLLTKPITFNGHLVSLGSYRDLVTGHNTELPVSLTYFLSFPEGLIGFTAFTQHLKYDHYAKRVLVTHVDVLPDRLRSWYRLTQTDSGCRVQRYTKYDPLTADGTLLATAVDLDTSRSEDIPFWHRGPEKGSKGTKRTAQDLYGSTGRFSYYSLNSLMSYVGPIRALGKRIYLQSEYYETMGTDISGSSWVHAASPNTEAGEFNRSFIVNRLTELGLAVDLTYEESESGYFSIVVTPHIGSVHNNIADVGQGISQLIPILLKMAELQFARNQQSKRQYRSVSQLSRQLFLIEQPEIHLHPAAQAALGSMFVGVTKSLEASLIIETHSDHILNRIRIEVLEGKLSRSDIRILYFASDGEVHNIRLDEKARYSDAPNEFFETYAIEAEKIVRLRSKH
jgi:predicted ATPase